MPDFCESFTAAAREVCEGMLTEIIVPRFPPHRPPTAFQNGLPTLFLCAPALICGEWLHLTCRHPLPHTHANLTSTNLPQSHTSSPWIQKSTHNWTFQLYGDKYRCLCTGCFCKGRSLKVGENLNMGKEREDFEVLLLYKKQLDGKVLGLRGRLNAWSSWHRFICTSEIRTQKMQTMEIDGFFAIESTASWRLTRCPCSHQRIKNSHKQARNSNSAILSSVAQLAWAFKVAISRQLLDLSQTPPTVIWGLWYRAVHDRPQLSPWAFACADYASQDWFPCIAQRHCPIEC